MCYTCGCKRPFDDMGDPKNITEKNITEAGVTDAIAKAGTLTAKKNMLELLQAELGSNEMEKPKEQYQRHICGTFDACRNWSL